MRGRGRWPSGQETGEGKQRVTRMWPGREKEKGGFLAARKGSSSPKRSLSRLALLYGARPDPNDSDLFQRHGSSTLTGVSQAPHAALR